MNLDSTPSLPPSGPLATEPVTWAGSGEERRKGRNPGPEEGRLQGAGVGWGGGPRGFIRRTLQGWNRTPCPLQLVAGQRPLVLKRFASDLWEETLSRGLGGTWRPRGGYSPNGEDRRHHSHPGCRSCDRCLLEQSDRGLTVFRGPAGASLQGQPLCRGLKGLQWQRGNDKVSGHAGPCVLYYNHPVRGARCHPRASQTPAPGPLVLAGGPCMPTGPPWPSFSVRQEGARYGGDTQLPQISLACPFLRRLPVPPCSQEQALGSSGGGRTVWLVALDAPLGMSGTRLILESELTTDLTLGTAWPSLILGERAAVGGGRSSTKRTSRGPTCGQGSHGLLSTV